MEERLKGRWQDDDEAEELSRRFLSYTSLMPVTRFLGRGLEQSFC